RNYRCGVLEPRRSTAPRLAGHRAAGRLSRRRSRGVAWPNTRPCQGRERRFESGRDRHDDPREPLRGLREALGEVAEWLKAAVSKTVMGHWPIESSNLSLSANTAICVTQLAVWLIRKQAPIPLRHNCMLM